MKINNLEILSPAGNSECFYADINSGADAIYLGLSNFNARMKAENFTTENISNFVEYAHLMGVKIYVTINTLLEDDDFDKLIDMVKILVKANVDAYIVQDFGVAYVLKNTFDGIVLHASTQMGIHNLYGAKVAEKMGFSRIVLSRETKLEDIKQIHNCTNLEIEYFVQGALCVAFSGNCYFSALEKNMSGNEGKCLQLCRLPYTNNLTQTTKYYLSARDLSLLENLQSLIDAGVTSFKIEGRMRHSGYCAISTRIYKTAIEKIKLNSLTKEWIENQKIILMQTFSRGNYNNNAYLQNSTPDNIINKDYQNHIGTKIGKVLDVKKFKDDLYKVTIESNIELHSGDGIKIIDTKTKNQIASLGIGSIKKLENNSYEFITKYKFSSNLSVFLTQNSKIEQKFLSCTKKIDIDINIFAYSEKKLKAEILLDNYNYGEYGIENFNENIKFEYESDIILQKAIKSPLSEDDFKTQINKLFDTPFNLKKLTLFSDGIFIPKSILNEFRRNLVENLKEFIIKSYKNNVTTFNKNNYEKIKNESINLLIPKNIAIIDENFSNLDKLTDFDKIVFSPKNYNFEVINEYYQKLNDKFVLNLPTIANHNDLKIIDEILNKINFNIDLFSNNIYGLFYSNKHNVICSPLNNIKNKFAIKNMLTLNIKTICASIESKQDFINDNNLVGFSNGNFPLMTFAHCPFKTIYDNNCTTCKFSNNLSYYNSGLGTYNISRRKISNCYFELEANINKKDIKFSIINYSK